MVFRKRFEVRRSKDWQSTGPQSATIAAPGRRRDRGIEVTRPGTPSRQPGRKGYTGRSLPRLPMPCLRSSFRPSRPVSWACSSRSSTRCPTPIRSTLLALTAGCNQKTSRDPVLNASETEVQAALDHLKTMSFVVESSGGRVMRYAHNAERVLAIPSRVRRAGRRPDAPRTANDRANCESTAIACIASRTRSAVEGFLHELAARLGRPARGRVAAPARRARNAMDASACPGRPAAEAPVAAVARAA